LENAAKERDSRVKIHDIPLLIVPEYDQTRDIWSESGGTTLQGTIHEMTDSAEYREGTVKSTPARGVKKNLKPCASMQSEGEILVRVSPDGVPFGV
jgi:hypothetical protein